MEQVEIKARWKETFKVAWPLCLSYTPIGLACGILLHAAGFNTLLTGLVSLVIFSGGAQFLNCTDVNGECTDSNDCFNAFFP